MAPVVVNANGDRLLHQWCVCVHVWFPPTRAPPAAGADAGVAPRFGESSTSSAPSLRDVAAIVQQLSLDGASIVLIVPPTAHFDSSVGLAVAELRRGPSAVRAHLSCVVVWGPFPVVLVLAPSGARGAASRGA